MNEQQHTSSMQEREIWCGWAIEMERKKLKRTSAGVHKYTHSQHKHIQLKFHAVIYMCNVYFHTIPEILLYLFNICALSLIFSFTWLGLIFDVVIVVRFGSVSGHDSNHVCLLAFLPSFSGSIFSLFFFIFFLNLSRFFTR